MVVRNAMASISELKLVDRTASQEQAATLRSYSDITNSFE